MDPGTLRTAYPEGADRPRPQPQPLARPRLDFEVLVLADHLHMGVRRPGTLALSTITHLLLATALILIPLFLDETLPAPDSAIRAFFVQPAELAPPPPPPPPPPATARRPRRAPVAPRPQPKTEAPDEFVAPITVPEEIPLDEGLMPILGGEGVEGGVEGGVPGGVVGGIVGGLPEAPPPPQKIVRIGGAISPPALLRRVPPEYPTIASDARIHGIVILEAHVDETGAVRDVKVLRGIPLLDEAAIAAVRQWRYKPLLLNGVPTEFLLSVTVQFHLETGARRSSGA